MLVVDERAAIRAGVRAVLACEPGLRVDATRSWSNAIARAKAGGVDLCLIDYDFAREGKGLLLARQLKELAQAPRVVLYSAFIDGYLAGAAMVAGADGLICQHAPGDELAQVLRRVTLGEQQSSTIPPSAMGELCARLHPADRPIVAMLVHNTRRTHIAEVMGISDRWLRTRTWAILEQLRVRQRPAGPGPSAPMLDVAA